MAETVADALLRVRAVGFTPQQPITFKSGLISPVYVDNRRLPFYVTEWKKIIHGFSEIIEQQGLLVDVVAGIETAGIPHSAALGFELRKPSVFVRKKVKDHGTKSRVEGGKVEDKRVLLIEDHITTGGSSLAAVDALRESGAVVDTCLAITSYEFKEAQRAFKRAGVKLFTLTSFSSILKLALRRQLFSPEDSQAIRQWFADPYHWRSK